MEDTDILGEMIKDTARVNLESFSYSSREFVRLEENLVARGQKPYFVVIQGVPPDAFVIKTDAFPPPTAIFKGTKGESKRADFVIVSQSMKCILYIELKNTNSINRIIAQQLAGAKCFMAYCKEVGKSFWGKRDFLEGYQHRFIGIRYEKGTKERPRLGRNKGIHDTPENFMKIMGNKKWQFDHLARVSK